MPLRQVLNCVHVRSVGKVTTLDLHWRMLPEVLPGTLIPDSSSNHAVPVVAPQQYRVSGRPVVHGSCQRCSVRMSRDTTYDVRGEARLVHGYDKGRGNSGVVLHSCQTSPQRGTHPESPVRCLDHLDRVVQFSCDLRSGGAGDDDYRRAPSRRKHARRADRPGDAGRVADEGFGQAHAVAGACGQEEACDLHTRRVAISLSEQ
jgi:hypothetical protein